jgi:hypothetical protein
MTMNTIHIINITQHNIKHIKYRKRRIKRTHIAINISKTKKKRGVREREREKGVTNRRNEAVFRAAFLSRLPQTTKDENNITQDFNSFSYK